MHELTLSASVSMWIAVAKRFYLMHHIICIIYYLCLYQSLEKGESDQWMDISRRWGDQLLYDPRGRERALEVEEITSVCSERIFEVQKLQNFRDKSTFTVRVPIVFESGTIFNSYVERILKDVSLKN